MNLPLASLQKHIMNILQAETEINEIIANALCTLYSQFLSILLYLVGLVLRIILTVL